jgi:hypothetical protein
VGPFLLAVSKLCPCCDQNFKLLFLAPLIMTPALNSETPPLDTTISNSNSTAAYP